jgi:hypothetical protein
MADYEPRMLLKTTSDPRKTCAWEPRWERHDEQPSVAPDPPGQPAETSPRSRTDLNGSGCPRRYLRIKRLGVRVPPSAPQSPQVRAIFSGVRGGLHACLRPCSGLPLQDHPEASSPPTASSPPRPTPCGSSTRPARTRRPSSASTTPPTSSTEAAADHAHARAPGRASLPIARHIRTAYHRQQPRLSCLNRGANQRGRDRPNAPGREPMTGRTIRAEIRV